MMTRKVDGIVNSFIAPFILALLLQGCLGMPQKPEQEAKVIVPLKLTADSGYLSKKDLLLFLESNELGDTLNTWWKQWKQEDTLGKYYKTDDNGHLLCVVASDDKGNVESNRLILLDRHGIYKASQDFFCDWCKINRRTEALQKRGKYFVTYTCGHGAAFTSSWFCLFRTLSERNEADQILESQYKGAPSCTNVSATWKLSGDSCIAVYTIEKGTATEGGCEMAPPTKMAITYSRGTNGRWMTRDSSKLKLLQLEK